MLVAEFVAEFPPVFVMVFVAAVAVFEVVTLCTVWTVAGIVSLGNPPGGPPCGNPL